MRYTVSHLNAVLTERVSRIAGALAVVPLLACRAVLEGFVFVADIVEEVNLVLGREESHRDAVYGCISPSLKVACKKT